MISVLEWTDESNKIPAGKVLHYQGTILMYFTLLLANSRTCIQLRYCIEYWSIVTVVVKSAAA